MSALATEPRFEHVAELCGDVRCELVRGRSALTVVANRPPLKLLTPRSSGVARRVVLSSYGGGLVAGDRVPVRVAVDDGAACILSTQSSSKVYRSDGRRCHQSLQATVGDDAMLAVLPDPISCYAGASYTQSQVFELSPTGNLVWLDWLTSGRWARQERWAFDHVASRTDIRVDGRMRLRETIDLSGDVGSAFRMGGFDCYAVLAIVGPRFSALAEHAVQTVDAAPLAPGFDLLAFASHIDGGAVIRIVGPRAQVVQERLREMPRPLSELLQDDPWARKW